GAHGQVRRQDEAGAPPLRMAAWGGAGVPLLDQPAAVGQAAVAEADAPQVGVADPLPPGTPPQGPAPAVGPRGGAARRAAGARRSPSPPAAPAGRRARHGRGSSR